MVVEECDTSTIDKTELITLGGKESAQTFLGHNRLQPCNTLVARMQNAKPKATTDSGCCYYGNKDNPLCSDPD